MPYTIAQKRATLKWRENNREEFNEYMLQKNKEYYNNNLEERRRKRMEKYYYDKYNSYEEICKIFRKIKI